MIPKIIHYCWFGGNSLPALEKNCIKSWEKILPDFEIVRWDESNFDLDKYPFAKQAYKLKKFAFCADVCRLHALYKYGGIYLDTDIEILRPLDELMDRPLFMGFETDNVIQTGIIGAEPGNKVIKDMLDYYVERNGFDPRTDGTIANSELFATYFRELGYPMDNNNFINESVTLLSSEYLCPIDQATWEIKVTPNTYCIHYLSGSWLPKKHLLSRKLKSFVGNLIGYDSVAKLRSLLGR